MGRRIWNVLVVSVVSLGIWVPRAFLAETMGGRRDSHRLGPGKV